MEALSQATFNALATLNVQLVLIAAITCGIIRDRQGSYFALSLFFFYAGAICLDDWFKYNDPEYVWRYVRWSLYDVTFLAWLYLLSKKKLVSTYVVACSSAIEFVAILALMIRMLDGVYSNAEITQPYFGPLIWATNFSYVVLAFSPVIRNVVRRSLKCN